MNKGSKHRPRKRSTNVVQLDQAPTPVKTGGIASTKALTVSVALGAVSLLAGAMWLGRGGVDSVSDAQREQIEADFQNATYEMERVAWQDPASKAAALVLLELDQQESDEIIATFDTVDTDIGWVIVWDNFAEDGDVVQVTANGITQEVPIRNAPTRVLVPFPDSGFVQITGIFDGGGGITAAVVGPSGEVRFPPLAVGQSIELPVR